MRWKTLSRLNSSARRWWKATRAEWILLDYFDFVIHVFSKHARDFYGLDRLWGSATRIEFPDVA